MPSFRARDFGGPSSRDEGKMSKRTFQPSNTSRRRTHGFRVRMKTRNGQAVTTYRK